MPAVFARLDRMELPPPWGHRWAGRIDELEIDSEALTPNPLGDPHRRPLYVYTPPGYRWVMEVRCGPLQTGGN